MSPLELIDFNLKWNKEIGVSTGMSFVESIVQEEQNKPLTTDIIGPIHTFSLQI
jgi:hypothetical protein